MISILISLSLTSSILNCSYDLKDGKEKEISKLSQKTDYYSYIKVTEDQELNFEIYGSYI